jgi:hypothetical protein
LLARLHLGPWLRGRLDSIAIEKDTLLKAHARKDQSG